LETVDELHQEYFDYRVAVVGHSLGGATATFAATEMRQHGHVVDLVSHTPLPKTEWRRSWPDKIAIASPQIGNDKTVDYIMSHSPMLGDDFRLVHAGDPIPTVPDSWLGYRSTGPNYIIQTDNDITPRAQDIVRSDEPAVESLLGINLVDAYESHVWYFRKISACYDGGLISFRWHSSAVVAMEIWVSSWGVNPHSGQRLPSAFPELAISHLSIYMYQ
jgi:hypothetical protein